MKAAALLALVVCIGACRERTSSHPEPSPAERLDGSDPGQLVSWLLEEGEDLRQLPFADIVEAASGKQVIPMDAEAEVDRAILDVLATAFDQALAIQNKPESPVRGLRRINEASRFFEDDIAAAINAHPDFECAPPLNADGKTQRSGYPDLMLTHLSSGRVTYIDPKLYEATSRDSSLRTFYYTPKGRTGKVLHDAHHLLVGIAHDGNDGDWQFTSWEVIDLAKFKVRMKAEFQASNRDLYREDLLLRRSKGPEPKD